MESLTSSCSKALFDGLGSSKRLVSAFHLSDRLEFPFSNVKVCNFRFLQIVQHKGIFPLHAVPYESQVDLEAEEPQAQETDFGEETTYVRIKFQLQKDCMFGEHFLIVGDDPLMGAWDPSNALPMTWSEGHQWFVEMDVPAGKPIQYKFILKSVSGDFIWQRGSDRVFKTWETLNRITVFEDWENADLQKIVEEEPLDYSNVKPLTASEMANLSEKLDLPEEEEEEVEEIVTVNNSVEAVETNALDIEDSKTHFLEEEQPLVQPDMQLIIGDITSSFSMEEPMAMVAENIDSSEFTPRRRGVNNMALQSEVTVHDLEQMGKVSQVNNQGKEDEKVNNLFEVEENPVLVPGLTPPKSEETEETTNDEVEERVNVNNSVEAVETKDHNMPEVLFNEEQEESDDGNPQEEAEVLSDEPEMVDKEFQDKFHSTTAIVKVPEIHMDHENVLESDIQWGRGIFKKLLSKLGLLRKILR